MKSAARAANKITSMILFVMATTSLITMCLVLQIDGIVHAILYRYGLQSSAQWAEPYRTIAGIIFAVGWSNVMSALALQFYIFVSWRKVTKEEAQSENLVLEQARHLLEGSEQKASSTEENKDTDVSASAGIVDRDVARLTYAEEPIYDAVVCYFHPDTEGQSFRTDFPYREFKQSELMRSYRAKRISKDEYTKGLIKAFPLRLEQDISDKILDYLEGCLKHITDAEFSLAVVRECRQNKDKWNTLWMKICRQYETELLQDVEEEIQKHETVHDGKAKEKNNQESKPTQSTEQTEKGEDQKEPELPIEQEEPTPKPPETDEESPILAGL